MSYPRRKISPSFIIIILIILIGGYYIVGPYFLYSGDIEISIKGSGATFPYPLIQSLIDHYTQINPNIMIDYVSIGSGAGQANLLNKLVDFAGTDAPLTDEQLESAEEWVLHIPYAIGGVVLAYNLPNFETTLQLDAELIARIFSGEIRRWNDPLLVETNPALSNYDEEIFVIHRSDASGTTYIFTLFLSKESTLWRDNFGTGKSINWPTLDRFIGAKGNEGVANLIMQTPFSIGYIEFTYAVVIDIPMAAVRNRAGNYIPPTIESISRAGELRGIVLDPRDLRISDYIIDSYVEDAYPISAPTYFIVYEDWSVYTGDMDIIVNKARAFKNWVKWIILEGDQYFVELGYSPIPEALKNKVLEALDFISYSGVKIG
jgi:phosphate transport system substrate-binding protein